MVELGFDTAFTARMPEFKALAHNIALQVAALGPHSVEDLLRQKFAKNDAVTVRQMIAGASSVLGENIQVVRFIRWATEDTAEPDSPTHAPRAQRAV